MASSSTGVCSLVGPAFWNLPVVYLSDLCGLLNSNLVALPQTPFTKSSKLKPA